MLCRVCNRECAPDEFYRRVTSRCKDCHKAAMKLNRLTNPKVQEYDRLRAKTPDRQDKARRISRRWRQDHPEAYHAQTAVNNAVRDRRLVKLPCMICGASENVHGHHKDYSRPLNVIWLCAKCHHRVHATFPELGGHFEGAR